jgi:hypothetical protein
MHPGAKTACPKNGYSKQIKKVLQSTHNFAFVAFLN